ncbi:serine hydrolase domain-containing protein [Pseudonocardia asaccharolytica]|uniref:serine hydrolase domain-containing protein n=1 Tax=Pseudonocardia asaccharolytica TaxID=54010 RepID=UPI0011BE0190|nr:serine hydrolase [Pseudonocardia asaccharolytica]
MITVGGLAGGVAFAAPDLPSLPELPVAGAIIASGDATDCAMTRTGEYEESSPEAVGLDPAKVKEAIDYWAAQGSETVKVFRHGCLVGESGLDPALERVPRLNWSQTKTVSALIAGVAEKQGLIDVDAPIGDYLPEGLGDEAHRAITVRNVLNMTTGVQMNWARGLNLFTDISRAREAMSMTIEHEPGEYFEYDQTTPSVLNYVVQHAIWKAEPGLDYQEWAQREFFNKLGIPQSAYWWQRDRSGNTLGYSKLFLRPLEFGRLGELMRNDGTYDGVEIIDPSYMRELHTGTEANCGYGFLTWVNSCSGDDMQVNASLFARRVIAPAQPWIASAPSDMYFSFGLHGQHTFVIPSLDMVVTRSGEVPPDTLENTPNLDADPLAGAAVKEGYYNFFRTLMSAVTDMPDDVRDSIANPDGPWTGSPDLALDPETIIYPVDAAPGSYLAVGDQAPEGCTITGCENDPNDGTRWITDVPRTIPGVIGVEQRPNG